MTTAIITAAVLYIAGLTWAVIAQRKEIARQTMRADMSAGHAWKYQIALYGIAHSTAAIKSGTARKVHRMATDALGVVE